MADEEDSLVNKRVRTVGELLKNQLRIGFARMLTNARERLSAKNIENVTPKNITNNKPIYSQIKLFFNSSKLSHFMDQMNPLAQMSNKRRISALPPGIVSSRENVPFSIRNVNSTHYGRICPIESPEGPNIGLVLNFASYAQINEYGFIQTPYFKVENSKVITKPVYLTAIEEINQKIAQSHIKIENGKLIGKNITVRINSEYMLVGAEDVDYIDVSSKQFTSIAASAIPFLENDDANRALMGSNMQRQAVPLVKTEAPLVATGIEKEIARFSASNLTCNEDGEIVYVDAELIKLKNKDGKIVKYNLRTFERSNQGSVISQKPIVKIGQKVKTGDLLVDGPSFDNGEMALGKNILVAFST
jgi:DNA-directed RNA polymerase subunit beta